MTQKINSADYSFSTSENFSEVYNIARSQFKKIILDFNEDFFFNDFKELFFGDSNYYKLFMRKQNTIICGTLAYIFNASAFCDIFFWNDDAFKKNTQEFRFFCEYFFNKTKSFGIENMVVPMDKSRHRHSSFKKYCEILYFSKEQYIIKDKNLAEEYANHYLLKVNYNNYFNAVTKANNID